MLRALFYRYLLFIKLDLTKQGQRLRQIEGLLQRISSAFVMLIAFKTISVFNSRLDNDKSFIESSSFRNMCFPPYFGVILAFL